MGTPTSFVPRITKIWHDYLTSKGVPLMAKDLGTSTRAVEAKELIAMTEHLGAQRIPLSAPAVVLVSLADGDLKGPPFPPCPFQDLP